MAEKIDPRTVKMLHKLLTAAKLAQETGKQQALNKIILSASRLTEKLNFNTNLADDELSFFANEEDIIRLSEYKQVAGVLVEQA
jgi:hypothetical protein